MPSFSGRRRGAASISTKWWPLALWAGAMLLVLGWAYGVVMRDRDTAMRTAEERVTALSRLAAEHVLRTLEGADTALGAARSQYRNAASWNALAGDRKAWQVIHDFAESLSAVPALFLVDDLGNLRLYGESFTFVPVRLSNRDYFRHHLSEPADVPRITPPVVDAVSGETVMLLTRRLYAPDGLFAGVAGATLRRDAFDAFFNSLSLSDGAILSLQTSDGTILVRHPDIPGAVGRKVDNEQHFPAIAAGAAEGVATTKSPIDGVVRVTAFHRMERFGLVMLAAVPVEYVLDGWRRQSYRLFAMLGVGIVVLSALFLALLRRYHYEVAARAELKNSEATLSRAQSVAHIGSWQVDVPTDRITWSEETYRIYGVTSDRRVDLDLVLEMIHPDDRDGVSKGLAALTANGAPFDTEHRIVTSSGGIRWVAAKAQVTFSADGRPMEILGTVQDITERREAEEALRRHQALLLEVQSVAKMGYYDYDMVADRWSSSAILDQIFGIGPDYCRSAAGWLDLVAPSHRAEMSDYLAGLQAGEHDFDTSYPILRRADGEERWVAGLGKVERDADGRPLRMVGTIKDITEQCRAEQALKDKAAELERSNTELEQFAYVASHDLREPLRMVSSYVDLLARRYGDKLGDDAREFIAFAKDGASRMDRLILDLLEYSRIGRITRPMLPVALGPVVERAVRALGAKMEESGAELATPPEVLPTVIGDGEELMRLFQNLIGNAVKYRAEDRAPVISITAENTGREWIITVADNGIGIDPKYYERVFLIFQRLHRRGEYEGTGIGLAVCKKIVEHHGGRIWVESAPGEGSRFSFTLQPIGQV